MICIIECGVSQLSRGGIRRRTWRFQSSTCDSDFATYDFPVAAPLEELSRNERDSPVAREFESKRNFKIDNKKERERERERGGGAKRVGVRMSSFNRSHTFLRFVRSSNHCG